MRRLRRPTPEWEAVTLVLLGSLAAVIGSVMLAVYSVGDGWARMVASYSVTIVDLWTFIAELGALWTGWTIYDAILDYRAVRLAIRLRLAQRAGPRWWVAVGNLVSNAMWMFVWLGFIWVGYAATVRAVPGLIAPVLVFLVLVSACIQVWNRYVRSKLRAFLYRTGGTGSAGRQVG